MENSYQYFKRDLSWLSFNYRVLLEAEDDTLPIYERIKFLSIYSSNLEEFYEIRDMFVPFYLPISVENIDPQEILKLTKSDKKMEAGTIKFILLKKIGKAVIDRTVTDEEIMAAIEEINFSEEDAHE
mgnify:FL=1